MLRWLIRATFRRANRASRLEDQERWLAWSWWLADVRSWLRGGPPWAELRARREQFLRRSHPFATTTVVEERG